MPKREQVISFLQKDISGHLNMVNTDVFFEFTVVILFCYNCVRKYFPRISVSVFTCPNSYICPI